MRSTLQYGTAEYPFEYYLDELKKYRTQYIEWHWHREFEFSLILSGTVTCRLGADTVALSSGDGLWINSETIHRIETEDNGVLVSFDFSPEFIAPKRSTIFVKYVQPFLSSDCSHIVFKKSNLQDCATLRLLEQTYACALLSSPGKELHIRNLIATVWEDMVIKAQGCLSNAKTQKDKRIHARLHEMMEYIAYHYEDPISLDDIAASANISRSEALRCFHVGIQTTPVQYLNNYRLNRAKEMLLSTADTVTTVASVTGFDNVGYFCRVFKKKYGNSPNAFRKHNK